jgi:uncharacterized membrane protein YbaN (DUF454 family)
MYNPKKMHPNQVSDRCIVRWSFVVAGCLCVGLATVGVFVPGLPTTPLALLASWLFYKSSPRLRAWLHSTRLGNVIRTYERRRGMTRSQRLWALALMIVMVTLSCTLFISSVVVRIVVAVAGLVGCVVVGFVVPSAKEE